MDQQAIIALALAVLALALKPGPGMMMAMSRTMANGMSACIAFMAGFLLVTLGYLVLVFVSFNIPGVDMVFITILVKTIAAAYLIWMGVKGLKDIHLEYMGDMEGYSFFDTFSAAVILTISNPLVIVFYAGILPTILDINAMTLNDMFIITTVVLVIEGVAPLVYCTPLALFRKKIPVEFLKGMRVCSSIVIILIGLYIGYTALPAQDIASVF